MTIKNLKPLTEKAARVATGSVPVGIVPGLILRVGKLRRTFFLRIQRHGKETWIRLGTLDEISVAQARKLALDKLHTIQTNGLHEVITPRFELYTVGQMLRDYIESESARGRWDERGRQTHADKANGWIANHMSSDFLALPTVNLSPERIRDEFGHLFLTMRSTPVKIVGELRRSFTWAVAHKTIPFMANPAATEIITSFLPSDRKRPKRSHMPFLTPGGFSIG